MPYGEMVIRDSIQKRKILGNSRGGGCLRVQYLASHEKILDFCCHLKIFIMKSKKGIED